MPNQAVAKLTENLKKAFPSDVRQRGRQYADEGAVTELETTEEGIEASVRGSKDYFVFVGLVDQTESHDEAGSLALECDCPYFDRAGICKHLWATMVEFDRLNENEPKASPGSANHAPLARISPDPSDPTAGGEPSATNSAFDALIEEFEQVLGSNPFQNASRADRRDDQGDQPHRPPQRPPQRPSHDPQWQEALHSVRREITRASSPPSEIWPRDAQIVYVLDISRSQISDGIIINVQVRSPKKNGGWKKPRFQQIDHRLATRLPDPFDRQILSMLNGSSNHWGFGSPFGVGLTPDTDLPAPMQQTVVGLMARSGRCFIRSDAREDDSEQWHSLGWDDRPWSLALTVERDQTGPLANGQANHDQPRSPQRGGRSEPYVLRGDFYRDGERISVEEPELCTSGGILVRGQTVGWFDAVDHWAWVSMLLERAEITVPPDQADEFLQTMFSSPKVPSVELPEPLQVTRVEPTTQRNELRMRQAESPYGVPRPSEKANPDLCAELSFAYDDQSIRSTHPNTNVFEPQSRRLITRDPQAETTAWNRLRELGFRLPNRDHGDTDLVLSSKKFAKVIPVLVKEGWHVEAEGTLHRQASSMSMDIRGSGIDWFELHGEATFGEQTVDLPTLLKTLQRGERFVKLGDGTLGMLPEQWLERYGKLARIGEVVDGDGENGSGDNAENEEQNPNHLRLRSTQIGLVDALLSEMPEIDHDKQVAQARKRIQGFNGIKPRNAPRGFHGQLRDYQHEGLGWLHFLNKMGLGGCLADDMGLGKTIQVLSLLESRRQKRKRDHGHTGPSLVVAPRSLVHNWQAEAQRFTPNLRVLAHIGQERFEEPGEEEMVDVDEPTDGQPDAQPNAQPNAQTDRRTEGPKTQDSGPRTSDAASIEHFNDYDLILTTYGTLRQDVGLLKDQRFDYAILDESQAIKNANTATAKAARLLPADHRLALSGTPIENHLGELASLFDFLNPGMLGHSDAWLSKTNGQTKARSETSELLAKAVRPFLLRRTKEQVASELPEKTEQTIHCELGTKQRRLYNELRDHYRASLLGKVNRDGLNKSKIQVLEALLRLRQAACHPGLIDKQRMDEPSAKIESLIAQLLETVREGHKVLVFSQFTQFLGIVRRRLEDEGVDHEYLDGRTRKRGERIDRFQNDPECKLFLISLKAGGTGLNLTAAEYVFLLDPWWNPAVESQAIDRVHRIGQTERVFAYRLIASDTVEEKVVELQNSKRDLADSIIRADRNLVRDLSVDDLQHLLG